MVAAGVLAGGVGLLIGGAGLGWPGLIGAVVGVVGGAMLPFLVVPPRLGFAGFDLGGAYGAYPPVGLVVLAVWFGFWFVVIPFLGRAA